MSRPDDVTIRGDAFDHPEGASLGIPDFDLLNGEGLVKKVRNDGGVKQGRLRLAPVTMADSPRAKGGKTLFPLVKRPFACAK